MAEMLWKNTRFYTALADQYVKSDIYKPNCKSVYQLNRQKSVCVMYMNLGETNYCYHLLLRTKTMQ